MKISKVSFYYRNQVKEAILWEKRLANYFSSNFPRLDIVSGKYKPQLVIVLGGDGTVLEAAKKFGSEPLYLGLNLGHVGFLTAIRNEKNFLKGVEKIMKGEYKISERNRLQASINRKGKVVVEDSALNEVLIQNLLGMVSLELFVGKHKLQQTWGSGLMISTATGSTAYNLSAHGPIVDPELDCLIITKLLDHSLPTPSLVLKSNETITIKIGNFRETERLHLHDLKENIDTVLAFDSQQLYKLVPGDTVTVVRSAQKVKIIETEVNYFFKSLQTQFALN